MSAYSVSLIETIFCISLGSTKEGVAILTISSFKTCAHRVSLPTILLWRLICSPNWYLFRKEKKKIKSPPFHLLSSAFSLLKGKKMHGWCVSEFGFDWDLITWPRAGSFYHIGKNKTKKEQTEKFLFQSSKEETAGIRHTCFFQVKLILKIAVDHQYLPCMTNFHYSSIWNSGRVSQWVYRPASYIWRLVNGFHFITASFS